MVLLPPGPTGLHPCTALTCSVQTHHDFGHLMLLCQCKPLFAVMGHVSINSSSCQSRTQILLEMFPLHRVPFSQTFSNGRRRGMGERGRKRKERSRAVLAADGKVSDRLSRILSNVTYLNHLERGICLATVLFGGKQTMISSSSRLGTWFPMKTLAVALCSAGKGGISRPILAWEAVTPLQHCSALRWKTLGCRKSLALI